MQKPLVECTYESGKKKQIITVFAENAENHLYHMEIKNVNIVVTPAIFQIVLEA